MLREAFEGRPHRQTDWLRFFTRGRGQTRERSGGGSTPSTCTGGGTGRGYVGLARGGGCLRAFALRKRYRFGAKLLRGNRSDLPWLAARQTEHRQARPRGRLLSIHACVPFAQGADASLALGIEVDPPTPIDETEKLRMEHQIGARPDHGLVPVRRKSCL
eukprot:2059547-Pleurochrysis_carterae.AAC.2